MARRTEAPTDPDDVARAVEVIGERVLVAVRATIDERSPEPARQIVGEFVGIDAQAAPDSRGGPAQLMATLTLVRRLSVVRERTADRPERVAEVLEWISEHLGKRYAARARYAVGPLESGAGAAEVRTAQAALREEFLPALTWLLSGAVALYGAGDPAWLDALEDGFPPVADAAPGPAGTR